MWTSSTLTGRGLHAAELGGGGTEDRGHTHSVWGGRSVPARGQVCPRVQSLCLSSRHHIGSVACRVGSVTGHPEFSTLPLSAASGNHERARAVRRPSRHTSHRKATHAPHAAALCVKSRPSHRPEFENILTCSAVTYSLLVRVPLLLLTCCDLLYIIRALGLLFLSHSFFLENCCWKKFPCFTALATRLIGMCLRPYLPPVRVIDIAAGCVYPMLTSPTKDDSD